MKKINKSKVLYFEGAGCVPRGEVENCRIRTAFTNRVGKKIYLELSGFEVTKSSPTAFHAYKNAAMVDHCFYITGDDDDCNKHSAGEWRSTFEYTKFNILSYVNSLNCSFDEVVILPDLAGYRVHKEGKEYNYGDTFEYNEELTKIRQAIYTYYYELEKGEGKKYPNFSLWVDKDNNNQLHLLRHFMGYNKHWLITLIGNDWEAVEAPLGHSGC